MKSKKRLLKKSCLYAIVDKKVCGKKSLYDIVNQLKRLQVGIIQFRDKKSNRESVLKEALRLSKLLSKSRSIFIVNDYLDVA